MCPLSFNQYQDLQNAVDDAESATIEGVGGRHAILMMVLRMLGYVVTGPVEALKLAKHLLDKGWDYYDDESP